MKLIFVTLVVAITIMVLSSQVDPAQGGLISSGKFNSMFFLSIIF
jgi:hypothetical protein